MALGEGKCTSEGITKVYAEWIKSYIPACDVTPATTQDCLRDGQILCKLIELTTGSPLVCNDQELNSTEASNLKVQTVLDFLEINGIDTKNISADDIAEGSLKETLDLLWIIILHFDVHTKNRAAYQRSVSMGKRFLLEWISRELPDTSIDTKGFFMDTLQSGSFLAKLIAKYCPLEEDVTSKEEGGDILCI
ncbi:predicted protein [Nematostella vectensis]|uniref:Calponin-homology (CH) domain-containing protein n=1 Tax=Nematostella vectensis TaxID=45351 RepID=A7RQ51_NEMVE|nr:predicted protein [Nematostella vectensis]|eukprot:XP_001638562.1 predicted protein [Nematostella vectensis]